MTSAANAQFNLPTSKINLILLIELLLPLAIAIPNDCEIDCSQFIDPVCGIVIEKDGSTTIERFQNICYFNRKKCYMKNVGDLRKIPAEKCGIKVKRSRRVHDFSVIGAHQACSHTCPTHCPDTYDPVCATIDYPTYNPKNPFKPVKRPMINHCHVDLFSCSMRLNVSLSPMTTCISGQSLLFMTSVAAMKSLGFLREGRRRNFLADLFPNTDVNYLVPDRTVHNDLMEHELSRTFDELDFNNDDGTTVATQRQERKKKTVTKRLGWLVIF